MTQGSVTWAASVPVTFIPADRDGRVEGVLLGWTRLAYAGAITWLSHTHGGGLVNGRECSGQTGCLNISEKFVLKTELGNRRCTIEGVPQAEL